MNMRPFSRLFSAAAFISALAFGRVLVAAENDLGTLGVRVLDAVTGKPTACTVTIIDAKGKTVAERENFRAGFRSSGQFTQQLPAGRTRVRVTRGFEIKAVERIVEVPAGGKIDLNLSLERVVNLRQRGWYAGDSHAHMLHGERTLPVDFDYVALTAQAEDLQYFSLGQAWTLEKPTPENLEAELKARSRPDCVLTWNLEAPKNYYRGDAGRCLGHCWNVGMRGRTAAGDDVIEVLLQASAHDYEVEKPICANFESHELIHAQGGAVFYTHPARFWMGSWGGQGGYPKQERMRVSNMAVELPLDTLLGPTYDGLDLMTSNGELAANTMAFELWSLLLNHGYRLAGTASSDACFDRPGGATVGSARTYTYLGEAFSLPGVAKAMAQGKNFVTTGPLLLVSAKGQPPGAVFPANSQPVELQIEAWAAGSDAKGLRRLEILRNGKPFRTNTFSANIVSVKTNMTLVESETAWYCARVFGCDPQRQRAFSGAFFFEGKDFRPPSPVPVQVKATLQDAGTGQKLNGTLTEVSFHGTLPRAGQTHSITGREALLKIPGTVRLRAEAPGYKPATLSPILDNPALLKLVTELAAEDLLNWETYERIKSMLGNSMLVFRLEKN